MTHINLVSESLSSHSDYSHSLPWLTSHSGDRVTLMTQESPKRWDMRCLGGWDRTGQDRRDSCNITWCLQALKQRRHKNTKWQSHNELYIIDKCPQYNCIRTNKLFWRQTLIYLMILMIFQDIGKFIFHFGLPGIVNWTVYSSCSATIHQCGIFNFFIHISLLYFQAFMMCSFKRSSFSYLFAEWSAHFAWCTMYFFLCL